jgi:hypothetical protein
LLQLALGVPAASGAQEGWVVVPLRRLLPPEPVTIPDMYPLPNMQSLNDHMVGCTIFPKINLVKAYHQISIANADIPKTR